jgi:hypothetical protein
MTGVFRKMTWEEIADENAKIREQNEQMLEALKDIEEVVISVPDDYTDMEDALQTIWSVVKEALAKAEEE